MTVLLDNVPQEVLEQIALVSATESFLGPPSSLPNLLLTCRRINASLTIAANPCLYAEIFAHKFDLPSPYYFSDSNCIDPGAFAAELRSRCLTLTRIRSQLDSARWEEDSDTQGPVLLHSYIIMLENGGKNERQLREYAKLDDWLKRFWFTNSGPLSAWYAVGMNRWPLDDANAALGMWLFWFLFQIDQYSKQEQKTWQTLNILKLYALGAHAYEITSPSWTDFIPSSGSKNIKTINHYGKECRIAIPPTSAPAILSFMTLLNTTVTQSTVDFPTPLPSSEAAAMGTAPGREWQSEWGRCVSLGAPSYSGTLSSAFDPGSVEGAWEGCFTYTEFTAYAALLAGSPPSTLHTSLVVRHKQTWKLKEYYYILDSNSSSASPDPVSPGDPLRSFFPAGTVLREHSDSLEVVEPRNKEPRRYIRGGLDRKEDQRDLRVLDVIIIGEGHSAWGQFNLIGRVRPCDGLITLSKEYVDGDRGRWLYRGYLVGNVNSNLAGRWRDTLSPVNARGYEGCFTMTRRR